MADKMACPDGWQEVPSPVDSWGRVNPYEGEASREVRSRFQLADKMIQSSWSMTRDMIDQLLEAGINLSGILDFDWEAVTPPVSRLVYAPVIGVLPPDPNFTVSRPEPFNYVHPSFTPFPNVPSVDVGNPPERPNVEAPADPNILAPTVREDYDFPPRPKLEFPDQPTLSPIVVPTPPSINILPWEGPDLPSSDGMDLPERQFEYDDIGDYTSTLLTNLVSKLNAIVVDGGTGLHPDVEQALYDRSFIRLETEKLRRDQEVYNAVAGRGFNLPTGVLSAGLTEVEKEFSRQLREVNMDILVKQAELAQQNTHFAMQLAGQVEQALMQDWQAKAVRLFEIASKSYEYFLTYYRSKAEIYNLRVEGYKAYAQAFEARLRAELAKVEIYKGELEGARLTVEIQKLTVDVYATVMGALKVRVDLYTAEMQAIAIELEVEKSKVDLYKIQYEAFATRVQAFKAIIDAYGTEVSAYSETVKAKMLEIQTHVMTVDGMVKERESVMQGKSLEIEGHKANIEHYKAELAKYKTDYDVYLARLEAEMEKNNFNIKVYEVKVDQAVREFTAEVEWYKNKILEISTRAELQLKQADGELESHRGEVLINIDRLKHVSGVLAQVSASALGAVNASAQIGFSAGWQSGISHQYGQQYNKQCSTSNNLHITGSLED